MNFTAIDFETANQYRNSACSVAVVEVKEGKIYDSYYALIRPPILKFHPINVGIHGITAADVQSQPNFPVLWPDLKGKLEKKNVIAHNAAFDMGVLRSCLAYYQLPMPQFLHFCTVSMARRVWPYLENHKLSTLGAYFHIDFQHHNALDDARACACIALLAAKELGANSFGELIEKLQLPKKAFAC